MEFIRPGTNIDFVGKRKLAFGLSILLILISVGSLIYHGGPNFGVDFAGGILIQTKFKAPVEADEIRKGLAAIGLGQATVQTFGESGANEFLIRAQEAEGLEMTNLSNVVSKALADKFGPGQVEIQRVEMVGPKVGADLREKALLALFAALLMIAVYISGRFEMKWFLSAVMAAALALVSYLASLLGIGLTLMIILAVVCTLALCWFLKLKYALGAIVALIHDVIITVGIFSLTNKEFTLSTVAALLAIIGYSLNDTIIVFDRIRETLGGSKRQEFGSVINRAVNATLSRTLLTSLTTLLVVLALLFLGGGVIHDFAFALTVGILIGTYSSVFVASPVLLLFPETMLRPPKKESKEDEDLLKNRFGDAASSTKPVAAAPPKKKNAGKKKKGGKKKKKKR